MKQAAVGLSLVHGEYEWKGRGWTESESEGSTRLKLGGSWQVGADVHDSSWSRGGWAWREKNMERERTMTGKASLLALQFDGPNA